MVTSVIKMIYKNKEREIPKFLQKVKMCMKNTKFHPKHHHVIPKYQRVKLE